MVGWRDPHDELSPLATTALTSQAVSGPTSPSQPPWADLIFLLQIPVEMVFLPDPGVALSVFLFALELFVSVLHPLL